MYRLIIILLCFLLVSCAQTTSPAVKPELNSQQTTSPAVKPTLKPQPGENRLRSIETVRSIHGCDHKKPPSVDIRQNEINLSTTINPPTLHPGEEFHHRFVYTMCPSRTLNTVKGKIVRKIYFKDKIDLVFDESGHFEFKPGEWEVNAYITIPPNAKSGFYYLKLSPITEVTSIKKKALFKKALLAPDLPFFVVKR